MFLSLIEFNTLSVKFSYTRVHLRIFGFIPDFPSFTLLSYHFLFHEDLNRAGHEIVNLMVHHLHVISFSAFEKKI